MQSPDGDQQPVDETSKQDSGKIEMQKQEEFQPLYEFPPGASLLPPSAEARPATFAQFQEKPASTPSVTAPRSDFVYPPPPSFYQEMPEAPQLPQYSPHPPLPAHKSRQATPFVPDARQAMSVPQYAEKMQTYLPPNVPPSSHQAGQPNARKSNKWIWIVVTILSIAVIGSCGLCGWGAYTIFNTVFQQIAGSSQVVNDYYTNLQAKNYTGAYNDLAPKGQISGLTQDQFVKQAAQLDKQYGPVISFVLAQPAFKSDPNTGPDLSHFTITVDVKRTYSSYTALLAVDKIGGTWKITEYDRI